MLDLSKVVTPTEETDQFFKKFLLVSGICLAAVFFLPWAYHRGSMGFSWDVFDKGEGGAKFFVVWIMLSAIGSIVMGVLPQIAVWVRSLVAVVLGFIPLFALLSIGGRFLAFGGPSSSGAGSLLPLSLLLLAFGCNYWATRTKSILAKVLVGVGILFCLLAYVVPYKYGFGRYSESIVPIAAIFKGIGRADNAFLVICLLYFFLGFLLSFVAVLVFPPVPDEASAFQRRKVARLLSLLYIAFLPGLFVLISLAMWVDGMAIFFLLYLAVVATIYFAFVVIGGGVLVAAGADKFGRWMKEGKEDAPSVAAPVQRPPAPSAAKPSQPPAAPASLEQRMAKLKNLLDQGLITPQEYEQKKKELLSSL